MVLDVEKLFREICADNVSHVKSIAAFRESQLLHDRIFAIFVQTRPRRNQSRRAKPPQNNSNQHSAVRTEAPHKDEKPIFIAYGAYSSRAAKVSVAQLQEERRIKGGKIVPISRGATALHVAAWKNAVKVAEFLLSQGANTGALDKNGVCAYKRAASREMCEVLRRPVPPLDLEVLSCGFGVARIQYNMVNVAPKVCTHEVKDLESGSVWKCDIRSEFVHTYSHDGRRESSLRTVIFETPPGSISSNERYRFTARVCNIEGIWSQPSKPTEPVQSMHWAEEWAQHSQKSKAVVSSKDEQKVYSEDSSGEDEVELKLGCISFGLVPPNQLIRRAVEQQRIAATKMQASYRMRSARKRMERLRKERKRNRRQNDSAKKIQAVVRQHLLIGGRDSRSSRIRDKKQQKSRRRGLKGDTFYLDQTRELQKEKRRLDFLVLNGVELML